MGLAEKVSDLQHQVKNLKSDIREGDNARKHLMREIEDYQEKLQACRIKLRDEKAEKLGLQKRFLGLQSKVQPAKAGRINGAVANSVKKVVRSSFWRKEKFIRSEAELEKWGAIIALEADGSKDKFHGKDPNSEEYKADMAKFVATYGPVITCCLNEYRSSCQSQLKKAWKKFESLCKEGKIPGAEAIPSELLRAPDPKELEQISLRKVWVDGDDAGLKALKEAWFLWYWDFLLPLCAGNGYWGIGQRYYGPISLFCPADKPGQKAVTSPTESMTVCMYENCYHKWNYEEQCDRLGVPVDPKHKHSTTQYSDSRAGQNRWGGWISEGRKRYASLVLKFRAARRSSRAKDVEEWALNKLREHNRIPEKEAKRKASKGRKRKRAEPAEEEEDEGYVSFAESDVDVTVAGSDVEEEDEEQAGEADE